jgi:hypothetical protein
VRGVNIGMAQAGCLDLHQDLTLAGFGHCYLVKTEDFGEIVYDGCLHEKLSIQEAGLFHFRNWLGWRSGEKGTPINQRSAGRPIPWIERPHFERYSCVQTAFTSV